MADIEIELYHQQKNKLFDAEINSVPIRVEISPLNAPKVEVDLELLEL